MAGFDLPIASDLRYLIYYFLDNNHLSNALFFATQLLAHEQSPDATHILSLCHLRLGQLSAAAERSELFGKTGQHLGCTYVFAQCCLGLGQFKNGIQALEQSKSAWYKIDNWGKHSESNRRIHPDAASIHCLLGKLYEGCNDINAAIESYSKALKLNPFMWDAFIHLCDTGVVIKTSNIFKPSPNILVSITEPSVSMSPSSKIPDLSSRRTPGDARSTQLQTKTMSIVDPFTTSTRHNRDISSEDSTYFLIPTKVPPHLPPKDMASSGVGTDPKSSGEADTAFIAQDPSMRTGRDHKNGMSASTIPKALRLSTRKSRTYRTESIAVPDRMQQNLMRKGRDSQLVGRHGASGLHSEEPASSAFVVGHKRSTSGQFAHSQSQELPGDAVTTRRSVRLMSQFHPSSESALSHKGIDREFRIPKAPSLKRAGKSSTSVAIHVESNRTDTEDFGPCPESRDSVPSTSFPAPTAPLPRTSERCEALYSLLGLFKKFGEGYYLLTHFKCWEALQLFESIPSSQRTAWVLSQMGRAHFEQANYAEAARTFAKARAITPLRTQDMDIYSTSLWHLKRDVDLAFLAYELVELDCRSPQTWCAVGNSFSLQRDHSNAIKCFVRATQLDPNFAYAFTLEGHEHISNEEYDKAIHAFRRGISAKKRHYNAWYGLGIIHQKLGKHDLAEIYFRTASRINPTNAVLIGCIGMALEGRKEPNKALQYYIRACDLLPDSVLLRERKAEALLKLKDLQGASVELGVLRDLAPDKAYVYVLLGRMYGLAKEKGKAVQNYAIALSLYPQGSQSIKSEIELLEHDDDLQMGLKSRTINHESLRKGTRILEAA